MLQLREYRPFLKAMRATFHSVCIYPRATVAGWVIALIILAVGVNGLTAATPTNDAADRATLLTGESFSLSGDLAKANSDYSGPPFTDPHWDTIYSYGARSLWWSWTAPHSGVWKWNAADSPLAARVYVFSQPAVGVFTHRSSTFLRPTPIDLATKQNLEFDRTGLFYADAGETLWIRILGANGGHWKQWSNDVGLDQYPVLIQFSPSEATPPANDNYSHRTPISTLPAHIDCDLTGATPEPSEPKVNDFSLGQTAWWSFQSASFGTVRISLDTSNTAPIVSVFEAGTDKPLARLAHSATQWATPCWQFNGGRSSVEFDVWAGVEYAIQFDRFPASSPACAWDITFIPAPANDAPESATPLIGTDLGMTISNVGATWRDGEPMLPKGAGSNSVWFSWEAPGPGVVQVSDVEPKRYADPAWYPSSSSSSSSQCGNDTLLGRSCQIGHPFEDLNPLPIFQPILGAFRSWLGELMAPPPASAVSHPVAPFPIYAGYHGELKQTEHYGLYFETQGSEKWMIAMDGENNTSGVVPLRFLWTPPPSNDAWNHRIHLTSEAGTVIGRTFAATGSDSEGLLLGFSNGVVRTAWWEWKAPSSGSWALPVTVTDSDVNMKVAAFRGVEPTVGNRIQESTDQPQIFQATEGETFQFAAYSWEGFGGGIRFGIRPVQEPTIRFSGIVRNLIETDYEFELSENCGLPLVIQESQDLIHWTTRYVTQRASATTYRLAVPAWPPAQFLRVRLQDPISSHE